jgi:hypothetical protein
VTGLDNYKTAKEPITLLSPLGLSPGLLYSALMTIKPQHLMVLTSREAADSLSEIIQRAEYSGSVDVVYVDDPFNCFQQANQKVEEMLNILNYSPCVINLTGGTTALQFIIVRAGTALENEGVQVHYVALIDRRGIQDQKDNPWVEGELVSVL